jgi:hypothetical protein
MGKQFERPYLEKIHHKKGLEWLKVKVLSSNSSSEKKERKKLDSHILAWGWS